MQRKITVFFLTFLIMGNTQSMNIFTDIAKEELCRTPDFISAKISPDGKLIAKIGADEFGIPNVTVSPIDEAGAASPCLSSFKTPEIIQFFWSADSKKVLLLKDEEGKGQLHLHGFDVETKEHTPYTKQFSQVNTKVIKLSSTENVAVVGLNHRNPHFHDLYKLNLDSGQFSLLLENDTFANFLFSDDLEAFLKIKIHEDGSWTAYLDDDTVFLNLTAEEAFETKFLSYNNQEKRVHFLDNRFSNTNQLTQKSVEAPYEEKVLGGQKFSDVDEVIFFQGKPKAYASYYTQKKWHTIDSKIQQDIDFLIEKVGSNFTLVSLNQEASIWIVSNSIPDKGNYFWIFQRDSHKLTQISPSTSCEPKDYSKMYEMVVTARDGKQLVCYYTIPREYDRGGYLDTPLPLVVIPHGGPFKVRDKFEFNPYHQWLASCGYAALSVNFRLSSGFGKEFVNAGNGEWGGKAHLDVIDAVEACIEKGLTERGRQAVFGGSYGGYESLAALTFTPKYFNCCVAICGPSNLKTVLKSTPEFWEFTSKPLSDETMFFTRRAFVTSMGGDPNDEEGAKYLEKCSPLHHLNEIQSPLLLVHGKNDHVVTENESRQIYDSMKKNNKDVTYIFFPNEGHRFANYANNLMYLDQAEQFLSQHLGGKYRPAERSLLADSTGEVFS